MNAKLLTALIASALSLTAGCASTATNAPAKETPAAAAQPKFTEAEKQSMTTDEKIAVYNADKEKDDKIICRKRARTGSHRKTRVCRTVGEMKAEQEAARETLSDIQQGGTKPAN